MNKNYNKKKYAVITALSILAVCLAVMLIWYVGTLKKTEAPVLEPEVSESGPDPMIPEIRIDGITEAETESEQETEEIGEKTGEPVSEEIMEEKIPDDLPAREDGNPRTSEEAVPPSEPPADMEQSVEVENPDEDGICQPDHVQSQEDLPQGGDVNPEGAVYVPGFGYMENSGSSEQSTSGTDGDWNRQIGTMQ